MLVGGVLGPNWIVTQAGNALLHKGHSPCNPLASPKPVIQKWV